MEHFVPKSRCPRLAYEWNNFRLVCGRFNGRKGDHRDVLDPFLLQNGVFVILFPALLVRPDVQLDEGIREKACSTIERLKLNDEISVSSRLGYVMDFCRGHIDDDFMRRRAPFLYREMRRQNLLNNSCAVMGV